MTRRIVRSVVQLIGVGLTILFLVIFLDNRYDVLPTAIHNHLPAHHPGLVVTDISVKSCSNINPLSSCRLDPSQWQRLDKDLYLGKSWTSKAYLHVKRKKEDDLVVGDQVVLDVRVSYMNPASADAKTPEAWESRPAGIWVLRSAKRHDSDSKHAVTGVDVLFGADAVDPRTGWDVKKTALLVDASSMLEPHITVRSGSHKVPDKPVLKIRQDGKFKIMQAADLHLSTGVGTCRDPEPPGQTCDADTRTLDFAGRLLEQEHPDLVVLTGDQINGETAPDPQSAIFKFADLFIKHKIPFACIFGNHDDNGPLTRSESMKIIETLPYSLAEFGPTAVSGVGNYVLEVLAPANSHHSAITLYLLDSHSVSPDKNQYPGYNWIKEDQIKWFKSIVNSLKPAHERYAKIHMDMAFIHIPLPEYQPSAKAKIVGAHREGVMAPKYNSHFKDALVEEGIPLISAGHDHANEYCLLDKDQAGKPQLWMCYGGGAGFGGYGGYGGYVRRMRFFEFDTNGGSVRTWKRVEYGDTEARVDLQRVIEGGRVLDAQ